MLVTPRVGAALGLGTASLLSGYGLGASVSPVDGGALIQHALARGVRYIDTAAAYGDSERLLGEVPGLATQPGVRLATKLTAAELVAGAFGRSQERLARITVDTLLMHSAGLEVLTDPRPAQVLLALKSSDAVRRTGASTYGVDAALLALRQPWCDVVQVEHSVLNPSVVKRVAAARRPDQQVVVRSVLCKGLLTNRRRDAAIPEQAAALIDELESVAASWSLTLAQLAIRFALDTPGVDVVLVGASDLAELDSALAAYDRPPLATDQREHLSRFDRSSESWTHPETWKSSQN